MKHWLPFLPLAMAVLLNVAFTFTNTPRSDSIRADFAKRAREIRASNNTAILDTYQKLTGSISCRAGDEDVPELVFRADGRFHLTN